MKQEYDFRDTEATYDDTTTCLQPPEQVVQNIISFASSYRTVVVEGMAIEVFLN